jgi:hypothetical protein
MLCKRENNQSTLWKNFLSNNYWAHARKTQLQRNGSKGQMVARDRLSKPLSFAEVLPWLVKRVFNVVPTLYGEG